MLAALETAVPDVAKPEVEVKPDVAPDAHVEAPNIETPVEAVFARLLIPDRGRGGEGSGDEY